jgi:hypothetical protein
LDFGRRNGIGLANIKGKACRGLGRLIGHFKGQAGLWQERLAGMGRGGGSYEAGRGKMKAKNQRPANRGSWLEKG